MRTQLARVHHVHAVLLLMTAACSQARPTEAPAEIPDEATSAASTEYNPALGAGVNYSETKTYRTCITDTSIDVTPQALSRTYNETRIKSARELNEALDISASISAIGLWGKAGASMSYFKDVDIDEQSFHWLVDANYVVTDESLKTNAPGFGLTRDAAAILDRHGLQAFYDACGTHFYSGRSLGARYTLLYQFTSKEDKVVERLKASASYSGFGVKAKASFSRFLELAEKSSILKVHTRIAGGGDEIKDYVSDPEALERELQKLRTDLFRHRRGVVLRWSKLSYDIFPEVQDAKRAANAPIAADTFRDDALSYYYSLYADNRAKIATLDRTLAMSSSEEPLYIYKEANARAMREGLAELLRQNDEISRRAKACIRGENECPTEGLAPLHVQIPEPDRDLSSLGQWQIVPEALPGSSPFVSLRGQPDAPSGDWRRFDTGRLLLDTPEGALLSTTKDGERALTVIGDFSIVLNPVTGCYQPNLCLGAHATICNFRAVERPAKLMDDGYPATRLQISMFDSNGFIIETISFHIKG